MPAIVTIEVLEVGADERPSQLAGLLSADLSDLDGLMLRRARGDKAPEGALGVDLVAVRGHVQLCWLALLLIRVVETTSTLTWRNARHELDRMHLVTLTTDQRRPTGRAGCPRRATR